MATQITALLVMGMESNKSLDILLRFTKMSSENMKEAVYDHLVNGKGMAAAAAFNGVSKGNLSRDIDKLNAIAVNMNSYFEENYSKMLPVNKGVE